MIPTSELLNIFVSLIFFYGPIALVFGKEITYSTEYILTLSHEAKLTYRFYFSARIVNSNP